MKILDQYGKPLTRKDLAEPQTSRVAGLQNLTIQSSIDGLTPARVARILKAADAGDITAQAQLFDDMQDRDSHIHGEMGKRKLALLGLDWDVVPPRNPSASETAAAEWAKEILLDVVNDWEDLLLALMDGIGHGFAPVELEWERWGNEWIPQFHSRPQTWFRTTPDRRELRLMDGSAEGAPLTPFGWIMHAHVKAKTGYLSRTGLLRQLVWPFLYRAYAVGDFAEFLETYGLPIIVGKYFQGASEAEKSSLMNAVTNLGHDARAIMPADMELEIQSVTGSGSGSRHLDMADWAEKAISKLILGATLTSGADGKSSTNALGNVHNEVRKDILDADARQIAATLTRDLIYPLIALNKGGIDGLRRCPRLVFDSGEAEDLGLFAEALPKLATVMRIPAEWAHDKLRIPEAQDGEAVLGSNSPLPNPLPPAGEGTNPTPTGVRGEQTPPLPQAGDGGGEGNKAALTALTGNSTPAIEDQLATRLEQDAAPDMAAWLEQIQTMLDSAESLEEFRARLLAAYPGMDRSGMVAAMSAAFAAAHLRGMDEVASGDSPAVAQSGQPIHLTVNIEPARSVSKRIVRDENGGWTVIETPEGE